MDGAIINTNTKDTTNITEATDNKKTIGITGSPDAIDNINNNDNADTNTRINTNIGTNTNGSVDSCRTADATETTSNGTART